MLILPKDMGLTGEDSIVRAGRPSFYYQGGRPDLLALITGEPRWVLEVGCGVGNLAVAVQQHFPGCKVVGIEINPQAATEARLRGVYATFPVDVEEVELGELGFSPASFDCLVYGDVLEHLFNPWRVLKHHAVYLRAGGQVVASIPNIRNLRILGELAEGSWTYAEEGLLDISHLRFFTLAEIRKLFEFAGLHIRRIETLPPLDLPPDPPATINIGRLCINGISRQDLMELGTTQFLVDAVREG